MRCAYNRMISVACRKLTLCAFCNCLADNLFVERVIKCSVTTEVCFCVPVTTVRYKPKLHKLSRLKLLSMLLLHLFHNLFCVSSTDSICCGFIVHVYTTCRIQQVESLQQIHNKSNHWSLSMHLQ